MNNSLCKCLDEKVIIGVIKTVIVNGVEVEVKLYQCPACQVVEMK